MWIMLNRIGATGKDLINYRERPSGELDVEAIGQKAKQWAEFK